MELIHLSGRNLTVHVNGHSVCYDDFGKGEIPVIFIHGFPFDKSTWEAQLDSLKYSHRVIAYDIRGFGKSTSGSEKATIDLFADDLIKLMDELQVRNAIVCGLSMGGYIILNALNRFPERFKAIILSDTQCVADTPEGKKKRSQTIQQIETEGLTHFANNFTKSIFSKDSLDKKNELIKKILELILSAPMKSVIETLKALADRMEMCNSLEKITIPVLLICGIDDNITPLSQSVFMRNKIQQSTLHVIDNAGHMSNLEQTEIFNMHVNEFVNLLVK